MHVWSEGAGEVRREASVPLDNLQTPLRPFSRCLSPQVIEGAGWPCRLSTWALCPFQPRPRSSLLSPLTPTWTPPRMVPRTVWLQLSGGLLVCCAWYVLTCHLSALLLSRVLHKANAPAPVPLKFSHPGRWGVCSQSVHLFLASSLSCLH